MAVLQVTAIPTLLSYIFIFLSLSHTVYAVDCETATVGQPYSNCYDIAVANNINVDLLVQYNPGLDCSLLQLDQKLCVTAGDLPTTGPPENPDGSCYTYTVKTGEYCAIIGTEHGITVGQIEQFNENTYKWKGCSALQVGQVICLSTGTPPPIPINPDLHCGPESPSGGECPLKACCSAFGYCGITSEFCETAPNGDPCLSNCGYATLPTCDGSQVERHVGYYAGWAAKRKCDPVTVSQLDLSELTHVIYAFAVIKEDMSLDFDDAADGGHLTELVTKAAGDVKVLVAVGGWTFSEGATKDLFSTMIGSSANRATFISSAMAFISSYNIDGIDIDFEYPAAAERQGPPTDTPNLTTFFAELRASAGSSLISLATPAGYWFLRGFELDQIAPNLDFINMMSYDYHGPWDTDVVGQNSTAEPHSSLLDMIDSAKLYVKAGVDLTQINIGLAWYGRTYKLNDPTCAGYHCDMSGGGEKGQCSGESGVLTGFEVIDAMLEGDVRPVLDKKSQTRWFNHNGDLITFDDEETRTAKSQWASETCFGGTMIWSIDQQLPAGNALPGDGIPTQEPINIGLGAFWSEPTEGNCVSYGDRAWHSRLWKIPDGYDWVQACQESPITINGVIFDTPEKCDDQGFTGGLVGTWFVSSDDSYCKPHWGDFGDDGCVEFEKRRHWSRLWDIPSGISWYKMCSTTPATIDGQYFDHPVECDDQGWSGGEIGIWKVTDSTCAGNWGDFKDNGCADTLGRREWSSKLHDIPGSWEDACNNRDAEVEDEYFEHPTVCEKHVTGIWGVFETQDTTCGVPPCPPNKVWDYSSGSCGNCDGQSRLMSVAAANMVVRDIHGFPIFQNTSTNSNVTSLPPSHSNRSKHRRLSKALHQGIAIDINGTSMVDPEVLHTLEKRVKYCSPFYLPSPNPRLFVQNPDAWTGTSAEGPTASEIASSTQARNAFQEAWNDSFTNSNSAQEVGGWIYADPRNPGRIFIRRAPLDRSRPLNQLRPAPNSVAGIDLNRPESAPGRPPPAGFVLVANFHTHPMGASYGGDAGIPSSADHINAWARGVPGIIINRNGLVGYGPEQRAQLNSPPGYPMASEDWGGQGERGTHIGGDWRPNDAPNQQE